MDRQGAVESDSISARMRRLENPGLRTFSEDPLLVLESAKGSWLTDASGKQYLDFSGLYAVSIIGHNHDKVVDAIRHQAGTLMHCPSAFPSRVRAEFLEAVESIVPKELNTIMPAMTGGMANEFAISMARARRPRGRIVTFSGGYFGRSMGIVGYTAKEKYRDALGLDSEAAFLPFPNPLTMGQNATAKVMEILEIMAGPSGGLGEIAAVLVEPIQGHGGLIIPPADFLPRLREFCDRTGALLIADEIQCGNGRTGRMWASELWDVVPDILTLGKGIGGGMGIGAVAARRDAVKWAPDSVSTTFLTNNVNLAASVAAIGVMKSERLAERARAIGPKYLQRLKQQLSGLPGIAEIRGTGLWYAIELSDRAGETATKSTKKLLRDLQDHGVVVSSGGYSNNAIKIAPALNIDEGELSRGIDTVIARTKSWSATAE